MSGSDRPCQVVEALGAGVAQMLRELDPALAVEDQVAKAIFMPPKLFSSRHSYFHATKAIFMSLKLFSSRQSYFHPATAIFMPFVWCGEITNEILYRGV
jgi:hypothetical protein